MVRTTRSNRGHDSPINEENRTSRRAPTGHEFRNPDSTSFSVAPVGGHFTLAKEMKKHQDIILAVGVFIFSGLIVGWVITNRNTQRDWPGKQLQNAVMLGEALSGYRQVHASYPVRLDDLVAGGTLDQREFDQLQFRSEPRAEPEAWIYKTPAQITDIAIVGPSAIVPWSGHSGFTVTARADGGGELISSSKLNIIPSWAKK